MTMIVQALILAGSVPEWATSFRTLDKAAVCLIHHDRVGAARLAAAPPASAVERDRAVAVRAQVDRCATGVDEGRLAGAVAQRLYNDANVRRTVRWAAPNYEAIVANAAAARQEKDGQSAAVECLIALRPEAATALVRTKVGSAREQAALQLVADAMGGCVVKDQQLRFSPLDFRLVIARALFRESPLPNLIESGASRKLHLTRPPAS